jgi:uncharacterized membrane protein YraQ (UPF0718 family)
VEVNVLVFITTFISILYEALPFIILGAIIAGLLEELVPQSLVVRIIPRSRVLAIGIGGFLGALFPMCECGIIPVMRRMLRKGVPLSCCVCYMLAGPILNVVVMLSTFVAFSGTEDTLVAKPPVAVSTGPTVTPPSSVTKDATTPSNGTTASTSTTGGTVPQFGAFTMTALRMGLGFLVAFGTGLIVERQHRRHGNKLLAPLALPDVSQPATKDQDEGEPVRRSLLTRLGNISDAALHDFVDITVFLILGAILAAVSRVLFSHKQMEDLALGHPVLAIGIFMGLAILLCVCSEADAFIAASFRAVPPVPKLAFLVLGPMLDLKLYMMYTRVFRPRLIWTIISSVVLQVFLYSLLIHFLWRAYTGL